MSTKTRIVPGPAAGFLSFRRAAAAVALLCAAGTAGAATIHVPADFATIQAAVNASSSGDTIIVAAGTYNELVEIAPPHTSITLLGAQSGVDARTGRPAASESIIDGSGLAGVLHITASNVVIDGFTLQADAAVASGYNSAISLYQSLPGVTGFQALNNIIQHVPIGIAPTGDLVVIQHNLIRDTDVPGPAGDTGIYTDIGLTNALIDANKFSNVNNEAMDIANLSGGANNNVISNNEMGSQIYLYGQTGGQVTGNKVTNSTGGGIVLGGGPQSGLAITNNEVNGVTSGFGALRLRDDGGGPNSALTITNNKFNGGSGYGVRPGSGSYSGTLTVALGQLSGTPAVQNDDAALTLDTSANYWGTSNPATVAGFITGAGAANVDYTPLLDNNESLANLAVTGFQADLTSVTVHTAGPQTGATGRIQEGVNTVSGSTINVLAGTYTETLNVNKHCTILGPYAGVCGTAVRTNEAIIKPPAEGAAGNGSGASVVIVSAGGVTLDGLLIDGANSALDGAGGLTLTQAGGTKTHADGGIRGQGEFDNTTIENCIVQNIAYEAVDFGSYNAAGVGPYSDGSPAETVNINNLVSCNLIQNVGVVNDEGSGVRIRNNFYAVITGNTIQNARMGIQTGNFHNANTGGAPSIDHNIIATRRRGIFYNLHSGSPGPSVIPVHDNMITALADDPAIVSGGASVWTGVYIISQLGTVTATFADNTIDGSGNSYTVSAGYTVLSTDATTTTTISGGSASHVIYGVWVTNGDPNGFGAAATSDMSISISGLSVSLSNAGVYVDAPFNTVNVNAKVLNNCHLTQMSYGVLVVGDRATASVINNAATITSNVYGVYVQRGKALIENNDLTGNSGAGIYVSNGATVDAGDCSGGNITMLGTGSGTNGSSAGGNILSGYPFTNLGPWAIDDENPPGQNVRAQNNNFGAGPGQDINQVIHDSADGSFSTVIFSQLNAPTMAMAMPSSYCTFDGVTTVTLSASFIGPTGTLKWYADGCGTTALTPSNTGSPLVIAAPSMTTTYYVRAEDGPCLGPCTPVTVTVTPAPVVTANVDLANINTATDSPPGPASFVRCITFDFYLTGAPCPGGPSYSVSRSMTFNSTGHATDSFTVPCGTYVCAMARDPLHTLRRTANTPGSFAPVVGGYTVNFTAAAGKALQSGNLNDDAFIDILDFGGLVSRFGHTYSTGSDTACGYVFGPGDLPTRHADFTGNGNVGLGDYSFISTQIFFQRDADCCGTPLTDGQPVTDISVLDLARTDYEAARTADFNRDGRVNMADILYYGQHGLPRCAGDFNDDGAVSVQDIFTFLTNWFAGYPGADINDDHHVSVQDIFDFITVWFQGCP